MSIIGPDTLRDVIFFAAVIVGASGIAWTILTLIDGMRWFFRQEEDLNE